MAGKIRDTLDEALLGVDTGPADAAAVELARRYAEEIDGGGDLIKAGPALLAVLVQLGMTPKARSAVTGGGTPDGEQRSPLDDLRARRAARQHHAQAVD